jgi:hypothetical protein
MEDKINIFSPEVEEKERRVVETAEEVNRLT